MARPKRNYRPVFALSLVLYASMGAAGVVYSVQTYGHPPEVTLRFTNTYIQDLIEQGDTAGALAQLRLAADIEFLNEDVAVKLVQMARSAGDLESEIFGLRKVHTNDPRDIDTHNALSSALLRRRPIREQDAQEVIRHGEVVLRIDPRSAEAHEHMVRAYRALGRDDLADQHAEQARRLTPNFAPQSPGAWPSQ